MAIFADRQAVSRFISREAGGLLPIVVLDAGDSRAANCVLLADGPVSRLSPGLHTTVSRPRAGIGEVFSFQVVLDDDFDPRFSPQNPESWRFGLSLQIIEGKIQDEAHLKCVLRDVFPPRVPLWEKILLWFRDTAPYVWIPR
jgi:hypothetical protein